MSTETLRKFVFLTMFGKEQILWKILISLNKWFWSNQKKGTHINKTVFLLKVSQRLLDYAFLLFWSFFEKFIENFSF